MSTAIDIRALETGEDRFQDEPLDRVYFVAGGTNKSINVRDYTPNSTPQLDMTVREVRTRKKPHSPKNNDLIKEEIIQQWSGVVERVSGQDVVVVLQDLTDTTMPDERVTLDIREFDSNDSELLRPGAMFFWYMGYRQGRKSTKQRFSLFRFRRLPNWTQRELDLARSKAKEMFEFFNNDNTKNVTG